MDTELFYNPNANILYAPTFSGNLSGNASTATSATSATTATSATYADFSRTHKFGINGGVTLPTDTMLDIYDRGEGYGARMRLRTYAGNGLTIGAHAYGESYVWNEQGYNIGFGTSGQRRMTLTTSATLDMNGSTRITNMPDPNDNQDAATKIFVTRNCMNTIYTVNYYTNSWIGLPTMNMREYDYEFDVHYQSAPQYIWTYWKFNYTDYPNTSSGMMYYPNTGNSTGGERIDVANFNSYSNYWNYTVGTGYHPSGRHDAIVTYRMHALSSDTFIIYSINEGAIYFQPGWYGGWTQPYGASYARFMIFNLGGNNSNWAPYVMMVRGGNYEHSFYISMSIRQVKRVNV